MIYCPLSADRNEIRLIQTLWPDAHPDEPHTLYCTLEHVSLDDWKSEYKEFVNTDSLDLTHHELLLKWLANRSQVSSLLGENSTFTEVGRYMWGDYFALSYNRGDSARTETIILNGEPFQVTKNLYTALDKIRTIEIFNTRYMLWVDAICINQEDLQERNLQVQRMRHIYKQGVITYAWLGQKADESNNAIDLLNILAKGGDTKNVDANNNELSLEMIEETSWIALYRFLTSTPHKYM